ncbi:hypothetical protein JOF41_001580 [Saccharothrix coeruleofusca]|uniref:lysyl oxidase family protein n=1 Tax=Saccharothrix coeruleofusca TaxID=33919 RepID=UPI001AE6B53B|nr:lysyl oxidase family protein [Saccharothrix coeruleofusca]MBP2335402.1 hypothetical protein [Saccharothrix coeruleofusca]
MRKYPVALAAALVAVALVVVPRAHATAAQLLPDLRQAPVGCDGGFIGDLNRCDSWDVCAVADANAPNGDCLLTGAIRAVRLRFTTAVDNIGDGPLLLHAERASRDVPTMTARQAFQSGSDGSIPWTFAQAQHPLPTSVYYEPAQSHQHWHLGAFNHYQLRTPQGDALVTDRKNGFCLGDRYRVADRLAHRPPGAGRPEDALADYLRDNMCGHRAPEALSVTHGISVGSGDDYAHTVDFQWLDISRVPSGVYDVVNTVNGDRSLVEQDYANNSSSMAVSIQWPMGAAQPPKVITAPPVVRVLGHCPGTARCAATLPG